MKKTYTLEELNKMAEECENFYLNNLTTIPKGWCPTIEGSLYLNRLTSIPEDFNPTVGGSLSLDGFTSIPEGFNPTVGGSLYLNRLTSIPEGWSPTVGRDLFLGGLTSMPNGWNPTVGGNLYLYGLTSIPKGFNPTVGGKIYYCKYVKSKISKNRLQNGTYVPGKYLYADGILTHVKKCRKIGDYTYYIGKIKGRNVISDGKNYAHCDSFRDGVADLLFKSAADRGASQYEGLPLDTELTVDEAVTMYRIITGACKQGSKHFVDSLGELKEKYTIAEMLKITDGQYNSERFAKFFGR